MLMRRRKVPQIKYIGFHALKIVWELEHKREENGKKAVGKRLVHTESRSL